MFLLACSRSDHNPSAAVVSDYGECTSCSRSTSNRSIDYTAGGERPSPTKYLTTYSSEVLNASIPRVGSTFIVYFQVVHDYIPSLMMDVCPRIQSATFLDCCTPLRQIERLGACSRHLK